MSEEQQQRKQKSKAPQFKNDEYRLRKKLGSGGMATVYLARQVKLDRDVAIKVMSSRISQDKKFKARFLREARTLAQFKHPGIITIYEVESVDGRLFISMEYIDGRDLAFLMKRKLTVRQILEIVKRIADALAYAHERNYVHRDIKPENVLFEKSGRLVLTDFGIARTVNDNDTQLTQAGVSMGTPAYMAPEQFESSSVDHRADLYSLGVMLYQMLAGERPFASDTTAGMLYQHATAPIPNLPDEVKALQPVVDKLMAKRPDDRYQSATQLIRVIDKVLGSEAAQETLLTREQTATFEEQSLPAAAEPEPAPADEPAAVPEASRRPPMVWVAAGSVAVAIAAGVGVILLREPPAPAPIPEEPIASAPPALVQATPLDERPTTVVPPSKPAELRRFLGTTVADESVLAIDEGEALTLVVEKLRAFERRTDVPLIQKMDAWGFAAEVHEGAEEAELETVRAHFDGWTQIEEYSRKIESTEQEPLDFYYRGYGYQMVEFYDEAIADYRKALELDPASDFVAMFIEQSVTLREEALGKEAPRKEALSVQEPEEP